MSNRITIELCEEDRQRLDLIASLLTVGIEAQKVGKPDATQQAEKTEKVEPVNEHPVDDVSPHGCPNGAPGEPGVIPEPVAEPEQVNYTKDDVQALVLKLAAPDTGKKAAVKAIVNEYAKKISDIPEEKLNEVMAKLNQLAEEE